MTDHPHGVADFLAAARHGRLDPAMVGSTLADAREQLHAKRDRWEIEERTRAAAGMSLAAPPGPAWEDYQIAAAGGVPGLLDTVGFLLDTLHRISADASADPEEAVLRPGGTDAQKIATLALSAVGRPAPTPGKES